MADERDRLRKLRELEAQQVAATPVEKTTTRTKPLSEEQKIAYAEQKKAQREATALAEQLGAKIDPKTGLIDKETVTNPFGIYGPKGGKTKIFQGYRGSGKNRVFVITYADGTEDVTAAPEGGGDDKGGGKTETDREYLGSGASRVLRIYYSDGTFQDFPAAETVTKDTTTDALVEYQKQQDAAATKASRESAFDILKAEFTKYGLGSLVDTVKNLILDGVSKEEVTMKLRETQAYQTRFSGNKGRLDAGLNVYDESTYLELENQYDLALSSYGVLDAAGSTTAARQAKYGEWIAGTKSPNEIKGRVQLAVAAQAEDEVTKATLRQFYPMISDTDIISYFLNPKDTLPKLETKVRASQIGAAAVRQGLVTNVTTAEELAAFDITEEQAQRGYSAYAGMKQDIDKLTGIDRVTFGQAEAEGALLKGLASEQRKLEGLREREMARYKGASGVSKVALGDAAKGTF